MTELAGTPRPSVSAPRGTFSQALHPSKDPKFEAGAAQVSQREFCFYPNELPLIPFCCVLLEKGVQSEKCDNLGCGTGLPTTHKEQGFIIGNEETVDPNQSD